MVCPRYLLKIVGQILHLKFHTYASRKFGCVMFDGLAVITNRMRWVEIKEEKRKIIFESVHCYSPTPPR